MGNSKLFKIPQFVNGESNFIAILKNKDFMCLWLSQILSSFCAYMLNFALAYEIFERTGSAFYVSLLFFFYGLPVFILGLVAGIVVDYISRRKIMIYTNLLQALIVLLYLLINHNWVFLYPVIFLYSIIDEFYIPAEKAMMPILTKEKQYAVANFLFTLGGYAGMFIGFFITGVIIKILGLQSVFFIASFLLLLATLASVVIKKDQVNLSLKDFQKAPFAKMWQEIKDNYFFILKNRLVFLPFVIVIAFQVGVGVLGIALPKLATQILGINLLDLGFKIILPLTLGSFLGAILVDKNIVSQKKKLIAGSTLGLSITIFLIAILGQFRIIYYPAIIFLLIALGFNAIIVIITAQTMIQEQTPQQYMGRVAGTLKFLLTIASLIFVVIAGALIDFLGVLPVLFVIALIALIAGIGALKLRKKNFRDLNLKES